MPGGWRAGTAAQTTGGQQRRRHERPGSRPRRQSLQRPGERTTGTEQRPVVADRTRQLDLSGWWKVALMVAAVFGVAMVAAILLLGACDRLTAERSAAAAGRRRMAQRKRPAREPLRGGPQHRRTDRPFPWLRVRPVAGSGSPGEPPPGPTLLVYDETKPQPVSAGLSEISRSTESRCPTGPRRREPGSRLGRTRLQSRPHRNPANQPATPPQAAPARPASRLRPSPH